MPGKVRLKSVLIFVFRRKAVLKMFSGSKPTFGTPSNTGFGFNNNQQQASPFGNSFAKPATTGFQPTGFGQQSAPLFGTQPQAGGGLFGAASTTPAFGQTQTAPQTGFSGKLIT